MTSQRNITCEGVPLNSGSTNIFLDQKPKLHSGGTVIKVSKDNSPEVGVHINTTLAIASSRKIKLVFILNFLLSLLCMVISTSIGFYYWNEMLSMRRQLDLIKDHVFTENLKSERLDKMEKNMLVAPTKISDLESVVRQPRTHSESTLSRKYYVEDLGDDILLVDMKKKSPNEVNNPIRELTLLQKDIMIAHFHGNTEHNLETSATIGPWVRNLDISSKNSEETIELRTDYFFIKENGLYVVYAQITYRTKLPTCYYIFARNQRPSEDRQITTCSTAGETTTRTPQKSHLTCSVQTITRLNAGDYVNIAQREHNRTVLLQNGFSHIGFVKLSS